jgi:DNA-binding XRE family transcriptional regulator
MRRRFNNSRIEALRLRSDPADLTQGEVAQRLNVSERTIRRWESDARRRRAPPIDQAWDAIVEAWEQARGERARATLLSAMASLAIAQARQLRDDMQIQEIRSGVFPPPPIQEDPAAPPPPSFGDRFRAPPAQHARALEILNAMMAAAANDQSPSPSSDPPTPSET